MPYSCWTITTSVALRASTQIARRDADPSPSDATTSGSSSDSAGPHRTTSTAAPCATRPALNAAANVAIPHAVGGNVDSIPNVRTVDSSAPVGEDEETGTYKVALLRSARSRRQACEGRQSRDGRPAQANALIQDGSC